MNEAESTMRLHLHVPTAIQGELFPTSDAQPVTRGYKGSVASRVAGITYRQLDYWARRQIVEPSITPSHGSGSRRLYSFKDVVILAVSKKLLDAGINLQNVTAAIGFLAQRTAGQLENITIMCEDNMCTNARTASKWWRCCKAVGRCSEYPWDPCGSKSGMLLNARSMSIYPRCLPLRTRPVLLTTSLRCA